MRRARRCDNSPCRTEASTTTWSAFIGIVASGKFPWGALFGADRPEGKVGALSGPYYKGESL